MNKMSKRLNHIFDLVSGGVVADVGCDHGKLARRLLDEKKVDFIYVSDISADSLKKAEDLLAGYPNVKSICCDGLSLYTEDIDECVISGMGGDEIIKIISKSPINVNSYILSGQHNIIKLKKFLIDNGYNITYDIIIQDKDKFYNIIKTIKSGADNQIDDFYLYFGKDNFNNNPDFDKYLIYEYNKINNILNKNNELIEKQEYLSLIKKAIKLRGIKL